MSLGTVYHGIHINTYTSILLKNKKYFKVSVGEDKGNYYIQLVRNWSIHIEVIVEVPQTKRSIIRPSSDTPRYLPKGFLVNTSETYSINSSLVTEPTQVSKECVIYI